MDGRPKGNIKPPLHLEDYEVDFGCLELLSDLNDTPKSYVVARRNPKWEQWNKAIEDELNDLTSNETWKLVYTRKGRGYKQ